MIKFCNCCNGTAEEFTLFIHHQVDGLMMQFELSREEARMLYCSTITTLQLLGIFEAIAEREWMDKLFVEDSTYECYTCNKRFNQNGFITRRDKATFCTDECAEKYFEFRGYSESYDPISVSLEVNTCKS